MNEPFNTQAPMSSISYRSAFSLRAKILLGIFLIVLLTVAAMGYFVFSRSQSTNEFLVNQVGVSVNQEIEYRLAATVAREANTIHLFFSSMKNAVEFFGTATESVISNNYLIATEDNSWNAYNSLTRLPSGSWDNANTEPASIFIPAREEIHFDVARELSALKGLDELTLSLLERNPDIIAIYFGGRQGETVYYPNIDLAAIVPPDFDVTSRPWYVGAIESPDLNSKAVWSAPYLDAALNGLVITGSIPVYDEVADYHGVVAIDILLNTITQQVASISIGRSGYGFLIDAEGRVIAMPEKGYADFNLTANEIQSGDIDRLSLINRVPLEVFEVLAKMTSGQTGVRQVSINGVNRFIAYQPIPVVGYSLGLVVSEEEVLQGFVATTTTLGEETRNTLFSTVGVSLFLLALAVLAAYGIGNSITAPLGKLTEAAEAVADGNLNTRAEVKTRDEIGLLAETLNSMTATSQELISNLEERVADRTQVIEKRIAQIQAVAEVGKSVAAQRELEDLLNRTAHLISERFDFYHVGIFLLDSHSEFAILRASNSSGGAKMLERGHRLRVGAEGIVGTVAETAEARIVLDVGEDAVYFDNPDLPKTRSEMALPLVAVGETIGVLDIQSVKANVFSDEDIPILQVLADQLAIAVQNARLLHDSQEALTFAQKATGEVSREGWRSLIQNVDGLGYVSLMSGELTKIHSDFDENAENALLDGSSQISFEQKTLYVPVKVRGQSIAVMRLVKTSTSQNWTQDEIEDVEQIANQISNSLDSARLYSNAQQRAAMEQTLGEITTNITAFTDVDDIIRATVTQLGETLQDSDVALRIRTRWD